jgi:hypothetical protein
MLHTSDAYGPYTPVIPMHPSPIAPTSRGRASDPPPFDAFAGHLGAEAGR